MNLGIYLPLGESLSGMREHGQDVRFVKYYLGHYGKKFDKVFIFSYANEKYEGLPENCTLLPGRRIHRYIYGLILPIVQKKYIDKCDVFRCFHPSAAVPAVVGKIFFRKKFIFNYNYNYAKWAEIEGKAYLVPFINILLPALFKFADHIFVSDEKMQEDVNKYVLGEKITIVRNAVDTDSFKPRENKKQHNTKIILSVGRLEKQKNYSLLIEAVSKLSSAKVRVKIVGKGALKNELIKLAEEKKVDLEIIDVVPNDQLSEIYNQADLYVQPSLIEAPVKTLLEAMSCGLPTVASDVPGISDVIQDGKNGLLSQLDARELRSKINELLADSMFAKKIGSSARQTIIEKYNLFKFLELETKILKSI